MTLSLKPALLSIMKPQGSGAEYPYPNPESQPQTTLSNSLTATQDGNTPICVLIYSLPRTVLAWSLSLSQALL